MRLDFYSGQQCVKDFFLCLSEKTLSWPDVCSSFNFKITHSNECLACNHLHTYETTELCIEIPVPPDNSNLNEYVEEYFNISNLVGLRCEACQQFVQKEQKSQLTDECEAEFIIVILDRGILTMDGYKLIKNITNPANNVFIR